jgi:hypothetical protein
MRRFVTLAVLLLFSIPFGASITGCSKKTVVTYCDGGDSGLITGQLTTLTLQPRTTGISLNYGEIGQVGTPSGSDCKGNSSSVTNVQYGTTSETLADVVPTTGRLCAGSWNRNTGGAIPDYTVCNPTNQEGVAYVTATSGGVTSNPVAVYIHPVVTSIVLGAPSTNCAADPASNCFNTTALASSCTTTGAAIVNYTENACVSQGTIAQLAARVYQGTNPALAGNNISNLVGPLTFTPQTTTIATITACGQATALQPGSTVINAATSNSSSSAGFFSVCPPASITLSVPGQTSTSVNVNQNNPQNVVATILDTNGNTLTNLSLEYVSTTPTTIPVSGGTVTPGFPGAAAITAICQPPTCNVSPFNQIGLFGNGLTVNSNVVNVTTPGTNSTVLYVASTGSQYLLPIDFTNTNLGSPTRLPFAPNSMVLSQDESTLYMGSTTELMVASASSGAITKEDNTVSGTVLSVAPNSATIVITDPVRQLIYLYSSSGGVTSEYGGVATSATWTPDSTTVYITTTNNQLLTYSTFTGWNQASLTGTTNLATSGAVTVPSTGLFLSGSPVTARTSCPISTVSGTAGSQTVSNIFYPQTDANFTAVSANQLAATNDGAHILGASATQFSDINVTVPRGACPTPPATESFSPTLATTLNFTGISPTAITGVLATSDSAFGFVTYTGTGGVVPVYSPVSKTLTYAPLSGTATAPVAGVVSADNTTLFVGTSGDNLIHILTRGSTGFTDSSATTGIAIPVNPQLPAINGSGFATPNLLAQKPRKLTT